MGLDQALPPRHDATATATSSAGHASPAYSSFSARFAAFGPSASLASSFTAALAHASAPAALSAHAFGAQYSGHVAGVVDDRPPGLRSEAAAAAASQPAWRGWSGLLRSAPSGLEPESRAQAAAAADAPALLPTQAAAGRTGCAPPSTIAAVAALPRGQGGAVVQQHARREDSLLDALWNKQAKVVVAGGFAGAVSKTCTAPLARLTILYQVRGFEGKAPTLLEALQRVVRTQGIGSLWKGHLATLLHRIPYSAVNFTVYEQSLELLSPQFPSKAEGGTISTEAARYLIAGGLGGGSACAFAYPLDLVRTRLAAQLTGEARYRGIAHALYTIVRQEGVTGLYKGLGATLLQVTPTLAINFCAYELLKTWVAHQVHQPAQAPARGGAWGASAAPARAREDDGEWWRSKAFVSLLCGSLSGMVSSTVTFPLDLIRRNLQMGKGSLTYADVVRKVYAAGGLRGFYAGIIPEYFKVVPGVSIAFCTYEVLKELLGVER